VIRWTAGCNLFGARVRVDRKRLRLGVISGTEMACTRELERQDDWLLRFFRRDPRWRSSDGRLTITARGTAIKLQTRHAALEPSLATVSSRCGTVRESATTYSLNTDRGSVIADGVWPSRPPQPRLGIRLKERLLLRFQEKPAIDDEVQGVTAEFIKLRKDRWIPVGGERRAWELTRGDGWRLRLPDRGPSPNLLRLSARYPRRDGQRGFGATYFVGLRDRCG
jgi:META domain